MFSSILKTVVFLVLGFLLPTPLYCYEYKRSDVGISKRGKTLFWVLYSLALLLPILLMFVWTKGFEPILLLFILVVTSMYYIFNDSFMICENLTNVKSNVKNLRLWIQPILYVTLLFIVIMTRSSCSTVQKSLKEYSFVPSISIQAKKNDSFNIYYDISSSCYRVFIVKDDKITEVFPDTTNYKQDTVYLKETTTTTKSIVKTVLSHSKEKTHNDTSYELIFQNTR